MLHYTSSRARPHNYYLRSSYESRTIYGLRSMDYGLWTMVHRPSQGGFVISSQRGRWDQNWKMRVKSRELMVKPGHQSFVLGTPICHWCPDTLKADVFVVGHAGRMGHGVEPADECRYNDYYTTYSRLGIPAYTCPVYHHHSSDKTLNQAVQMMASLCLRVFIAFFI